MTETIRITDVPRLGQRERGGHKGDYGKVLIVGGSRGMIGAPALAANAALRGGAGLAMIAAPEPVQLFVAALATCATSIPLACDEDGVLLPAATRQVMDTAAGCDVVAAGPGFAVGNPQQQLIRALLEGDLPVVLDADGLNNLAKIDGWAELCRTPVVLTPHPGEFSRLTGRGITEIQSDRERIARDTAAAWARQVEAERVLLLKGAGTVVTDGTRVYVNETGNPGMASGGAGDVLTGLIAALIGQGLAPFDAAVLGACVHGRAGDLAVGERGEPGLIATDILECIPTALAERS